MYVATNGNDANPGTKAKPFATIEHARDAARQLRQGRNQKETGITIFLLGGDYVRTNALELTASDSGTTSAPTIWQSFKGENVRLLGGRSLGAFQPVTDSAPLARLPEKARTNVANAIFARWPFPISAS